MKIVIDTSSIYSDLSLSKTKIKTLSENSKITGNVIYFPQVVVDEAKNKYAEELVEVKLKIDKELADLYRKTNKKIENPVTNEFIKEQIEIFNKLFDSQIIKLDIKIIPYPSISHEALVKRALARKKPFSESGRGYRDALIWESIKSLIQPQQKLINEPEIIFITKNHTDFGDKDYNLHPDLLDNLNTDKIPEHSIKINPDMDKFINEYINPKLKLLNDIKSGLIEGDFKRLNIKKLVSNLVFNFLDSREFGFDEIDFPQEFENPSVSEIYDDYQFTVNDVRQLSDDEILIDGEVEVTCTFDFYIYKSDYYSMNEDDMPSISDKDWNDHYVAAYEDRIIKLKFLLTVNNSFTEVTSSEIELTD
ncbi:protein of unknown function [Mucilaginibacter sp. OK268]|uniref:PIN domain-containing protein n=1 Tax=Mucilaginibacter sp. OK268 TaxID=1881048 RepID=UPI00088250FF|nr:PIN domain-containing protein [Mucilaginibacter sp. OK268]SDP94947.1 protein of unknown function [Mucilaginibacter sp. OK268]